MLEPAVLVVAPTTPAVVAAVDFVAPVTEPVLPLISPVVEAAQPIITPTANVVTPVVTPIIAVTDPVASNPAVQPVGDAVTAVAHDVVDTLAVDFVALDSVALDSVALDSVALDSLADLDTMPAMRVAARPATGLLAVSRATPLADEATIVAAVDRPADLIASDRAPHRGASGRPLPTAPAAPSVPAAALLAAPTSMSGERVTAHDLPLAALLTSTATGGAPWWHSATGAFGWRSALVLSIIERPG